MKRVVSWMVILIMLFSLSACKQSNLPTEPPHSLETAPTVPSEPKPTEPKPTAPKPTEPKPTEPPETDPPAPEHSKLYIPELAVEDVITYFNEVCLDSEFVNGGDPSLIQKWMEPIYYIIEGTCTDKDIEVLNRFVGWLNKIEGFPGISQTADQGKCNMRIYFCDANEILQRLGQDFENVDGGVTYWYMNNAIYNAIICYRKDVSQQLRNSVILEEIYNGLGPVQDTNLREDSLIYQGFSQPQWLTEVDELIMKLLYHPDIKPGMNAQQCEKIIRQLYF